MIAVSALIPLIILVTLLILLVLLRQKQNAILRKLRLMKYSEKCILMDSLVETFGYHYLCYYDIFSTRLDAWQKQFGYTAAYDAGAAGLNMIFDCEPVYFNYHGKTWLIELWKGQYGISVGGEIGVYHSDRILQENEHKTEIFRPVEDHEQMELSLTLHFKNYCTAISGRHWWLTAFCVGKYAKPKNITMDVELQFPDRTMMTAFRNALLRVGYYPDELYEIGTTLQFTFIRSHTKQPGIFSRLHRSVVLRQNRALCRLYLSFTHPLKSSVDRLLFLYYHFPSAFRHTLRLHRTKPALKFLKDRRMP